MTLIDLARDAFEELHYLRYWQDANRTHATNWAECTDAECVERRVALAVASGEHQHFFQVSLGGACACGAGGSAGHRHLRSRGPDFVHSDDDDC